MSQQKLESLFLLHFPQWNNSVGKNFARFLFTLLLLTPMSSLHPLSYVHINFSTNTTLSSTLLSMWALLVNPRILRSASHHWEQGSSPDRLQRLEAWARSFPLLCIWTHFWAREPAIILVGRLPSRHLLPDSRFCLPFGYAGGLSHSCFPVLVLRLCPISGFEVGSVIASDT